VVRYDNFFKFAYDALPDDGVMLLHTITNGGAEAHRERKLPITMTLLRFVKFIVEEIFPGGRLPSVPQVEEHAPQAGFTVSPVQPLRPQYAKTLDIRASALEARKDDAIAIQSEEVYDRYNVTGCADLFRDGYINVCQFTHEKG
jgi:cyclopropane-fatty-acyl-phospholipid synthase